MKKLHECEYYHGTEFGTPFDYCSCNTVSGSCYCKDIQNCAFKLQLKLDMIKEETKKSLHCEYCNTITEIIGKEI